MMAASDLHIAPPVRGERPRVADFDRSLTCILGLPFDAVSSSQAVEHIRDAAFNGKRCFVSTPNLNFVMTARSDEAFRDSVLHSDLSLVDGMPLVWIARLTGTTVHERVSGADMFEALAAHPGPPVSVFLFGGPPGAAAKACEAINRGGGGLRCAGYDEPGFGSVESMSGSDRIERINRSGAQFVVVSLGAGKGQAWIEHNAGRLTAPVLSHLGAVVNFVAGTVKRAPHWMQVCGLEWLWRIKEEPALWRRYWSDGLSMMKMLPTHVLPQALEVRRWRAFGRRHAASPSLELQRTPLGQYLRLAGDWRRTDGLPQLREALRRCAVEAGHLSVDLAEATGISGEVTALLLLARGRFDGRGGFDVSGASRALRATLRRQLAAEALLGTGA